MRQVSPERSSSTRAVLTLAIPEKTEAAAAWDRLYQHHGRPSGIFAADEYLAGLDAIRG